MKTVLKGKIYMILLSDNCKIEDVETDICSMKKRGKTYSDTIYTFDIETTSYLILNGKQVPAIDYLKLSDKEQKDAIKCDFFILHYIYICCIML